MGDESMKLKKNVGTLDSVIRLVIAAVIAVLCFTRILTGTPAVILAILAAVFIVTGIVGICPLYMLFGISTRKKQT
jgi:amino acid transporter